jgi:hypothetical protein
VEWATLEWLFQQAGSDQVDVMTPKAERWYRA